MLKLTGIFVIFLFNCAVSSFKLNNVCERLSDYYIRNISPRCWYDPDLTANAYALASNHGYRLKSYQVITEDKYILTVFRISPKQSTKDVVYLQHPSASDANIWMDLGKNSLAFLLADAGYDVWMGNFRGTTYSMKHVYLNRHNKKYWNFSFHEMAIYDLPAQIHLVRKETNSKNKIIYVGHSLGTTTAYIYSSLLPADASANVKAFITWSPIAFAKNVKTILKYIAPFADIIMFLGRLTDLGLSGTTTNSPEHLFIKFFCFNVNVHFCAKFLEAVGGPSPLLSPARLPVLIYQNFAGFSLKSIVHYLQFVRDGGRFQWYNYGKIENKKYYGSIKPPIYPVENINVSMVFIYGGNDYCSVKSDVYYLYNKLSNRVRCGIYEIPQYNHFDFHYAKNVETMGYRMTINIIDKIVSGNYSETCISL